MISFLVVTEPYDSGGFCLGELYIGLVSHLVVTELCNQVVSYVVVPAYDCRAGLNLEKFHTYVVSVVVTRKRRLHCPPPWRTSTGGGTIQFEGVKF